MLAHRPASISALAVVLALLVTGCAGRPSAGAGAGAGEVVRVVDGDTVVVRIDGTDEPVRLLGIDTPESVDPRSPVECFGKEAAAYTASLVPPGTPVRLVRDVEARDRYDRLLAYVYRADDGTFVNLRLVQDGYAVVLTYPPNVAHADEFVAAAREAREAGRGLWSAC
ncbi:MAG: thermonuclease family protein [Actinomycetota bacterium]|nr:thermonuclease family protein [Actinomycetota bacterium]